MDGLPLHVIGCRVLAADLQAVESCVVIITLGSLKSDLATVDVVSLGAVSVVPISPEAIVNGFVSIVEVPVLRVAVLELESIGSCVVILALLAFDSECSTTGVVVALSFFWSSPGTP